MAEQMIFKRYEIKYMLNRSQFEKLKETMKDYMNADEHGKNTNCSLYFDTPQFLMIRRSMERPIYKEKLRVRSYGVAQKDSTVFVELKKKYDSVTYKRRIGMIESDMEKYLIGHTPVMDTQISREIDYVFKIYDKLEPAVMLSYDRQAFYAKDNHDFRMTFDENILWRDYDLSLIKGIYGRPLLEEDQILLEVKVASAFPMWLVRFLNENKIYKTSFSKYANAYKQMREMGRVMNREIEREFKQKIKRKINRERNRELYGGNRNYA